MTHRLKSTRILPPDWIRIRCNGRAEFIETMMTTAGRARGQQTGQNPLFETLSNLPPSDFYNKPSFPENPPRRRTKTYRARVLVGRKNFRRSRAPETPSLTWKFDDSNDNNNSVEAKSPTGGGRRVGQVISARKLGADLWRLHLSEFRSNSSLRLGLQPANAIVGELSIYSHVPNNLVQNPLNVSDPKKVLHHKFESSLQSANSAMERLTKWDPASNEFNQKFGLTNLVNKQTSNAPVVSALEETRARINYLETQRRSSKKKLEQFMQKLSEERGMWRSKEHEKILAIMDDMKAELSKEKKNCLRLEVVNSNLVNELANAKISIKHTLHEYKKERKAREMMEEVCDELAKEIGEDKAEVAMLKRELRKLWEEVEEDRKMLQMAEVWREERLQMKLVDAKVMLEEKYVQMNRIVTDLEAFLNSTRPTLDMEEVNKAKVLLVTAGEVNLTTTVVSGKLLAIRA